MAQITKLISDYSVSPRLQEFDEGDAGLNDIIMIKDSLKRPGGRVTIRNGVAAMKIQINPLRTIFPRRTGIIENGEGVRQIIDNPSFDEPNQYENRGLNNWNEEFSEWFVKQPTNGRRLDVQGSFPSDGTSYVQLGVEAVVSQFEVNAYHQIWQQFDFTNFTQLAFDYEAFNADPGGSTSEFSVYITDADPTTIGFVGVGLGSSTDRELLVTNVGAFTAGHTIDLSSITGYKNLVFRQSFARSGGTSDTTWARIDNLVVDPPIFSRKNQSNKWPLFGSEGRLKLGDGREHEDTSTPEIEIQPNEEFVYEGTLENIKITTLTSTYLMVVTG